MKTLRNILLFFTLVGIFFIALNVKFYVNRKQLKLCQNSELAHMEIETSKEKYTLDKLPDEDWQIMSGEESDVASGEYVILFAKLVCHIPYFESFEQDHDLTDGEKDAFGFSRPRGQITANDGEPVVITAGNVTPAGTEFYLINSKNSKTVYTITNKFFSLLFPNFYGLYYHLPFRELPQGHDLKIKFAETEIHLKMTNGIWQDEDHVLNPAAVKTLIEQLSTLRFSKFKNDLTPEEFGMFGLDVPDAVFEWQTPSEKIYTFKLVIVNRRCYLAREINHTTYLMIFNDKAPQEFITNLQALVSES